MVWVIGWVRLTRKNTGQVTDQLVFAMGQKNWVRVRVRVRSGQKILTRFAMSTSCITISSVPIPKKNVILIFMIKHNKLFLGPSQEPGCSFTTLVSLSDIVSSATTQRCKAWISNVRLNLFNHLIGFIPCQICL